MWYLQSAVKLHICEVVWRLKCILFGWEIKTTQALENMKHACVAYLACRRQHKTDDGDYDENPSIIEDIVFAYICKPQQQRSVVTSSTRLHWTTDIVINISAWDCCNSLWLCALVAQHLKRLAGTKYKIWVHILYSSTAHQSWSLHKEPGYVMFKAIAQLYVACVLYSVVSLYINLRASPLTAAGPRTAVWES